MGFDPGAHNNAAISIPGDCDTNAQSFSAAGNVSPNSSAHLEPNFGPFVLGPIVKTNKYASVFGSDPDSDSGPRHVGADVTSESCTNVHRAYPGPFSGADHV